jgi:hypothetical protein
LRNELIRQHDLALSLDTIHRTLFRHGEQVLKRPRRWRKGEQRYSRPIPGDRVQMDVCKIRPGVYQYTAIDDCSRYKVLGVYSRATGANTLDFLERLIEEMPFPIQRIQTDRGREFFAEAVQQRLMDCTIRTQSMHCGLAPGFRSGGWRPASRAAPVCRGHQRDSGRVHGVHPNEVCPCREPKAHQRHGFGQSSPSSSARLMAPIVSPVPTATCFRRLCLNGRRAIPPVLTQ